MARARGIKPGLYKNEDLAECSIWARYIFPGLWMLADREGRLEDRPKRIKGELLPFDNQDAEPLLVELASAGFIRRYQNKDGSFIQISKFLSHQSPHYSEKPSVIKPQDSEKTKVIKRGSQPPSSLTASSLIPDCPTSLSLTPDSGLPKKTSDALHAPGRTIPVWEAYSQAYKARHGAEPTRNRKVNGLLASFLERVPIEEAPAIAAFFVQHNGRLYVNSMHAIDLLLRDAEKLRTEWQTGRRMTDTEARGAEAFDSMRQQADRVGRLLETKS